MNEKSFPMIAGLVALLLMVLLVLAMMGPQSQRPVMPSDGSISQSAPQVRSGNAVRQSVDLPYPIPATVEVTP